MVCTAREIRCKYIHFLFATVYLYLVLYFFLTNAILPLTEKTEKETGNLSTLPNLFLTKMTSFWKRNTRTRTSTRRSRITKITKMAKAMIPTRGKVSRGMIVKAPFSSTNLIRRADDAFLHIRPVNQYRIEHGTIKKIDNIEPQTLVGEDFRTMTSLNSNARNLRAKAWQAKQADQKENKDRLERGQKRLQQVLTLKGPE